jgi:hypothetical protein
MAVMRQSWTDERLDDLNDRVSEGFGRMDERFAQVDARIDSVQRTMFQGAIALAGIQITAFVGLAGLILAQG